MDFLYELNNRSDASLKKRLFVFIGIIAILVLVFAISYVWLNYIVNEPMDQLAENYYDFVVEEGHGVSDIAENLEKMGLIRGDFYFKYYVWKIGNKNGFKAGKYEISKSMSIPQIVSVLVEDRSGEAQLTFLEGWTNVEFAGYVAEEVSKNRFGVSLSKSARDKINEEFLNAADKNYDFSFLKDKPQEASLEGYLFPDTYRIYRSASMEGIVQKMLANFDSKLTDDLRSEIEKQGWKIYDIVILASIVQKEVREEDMSKVAGIFINRLREDRKLESDATVNYVTGKHESRASLADIKIESPYNTYLYKGLPLGPIGNPGLAAIKAVVYPEFTDYRFFLTTEEGDIIYGKTFEEHIANQEKYL